MLEDVACYSGASRPSRMSHSCGRNFVHKGGRRRFSQGRWTKVSLRLPLGDTRPRDGLALAGLEAKGSCDFHTDWSDASRREGSCSRALPLRCCSPLAAAAAARADSSGHDRLDRRGEGRAALAAHRLGQHALRGQGAEAGGRACAVRFRQSVGLARAERHQGHADGARGGGAERDAGRRRADHRPALRRRGRCRRSGGAPVRTFR